MKYCVYVLIVVLAMIFGCETKSPEFSLIKNRVIIRNYEGKTTYSDVVFLSDPPDDAKSLLKLIEKYNEFSLSKDTIESKYDYFSRRFYRESYRTPKDFKDDESYTPDYLDDHIYDYIGSFEMKKCITTGNPIWSFDGLGGYLKLNIIFYEQDCFQIE